MLHWKTKQIPHIIVGSAGTLSWHMSHDATFYCAVLLSTNCNLTCNLITKLNAKHHLDKCKAFWKHTIQWRSTFREQKEQDLIKRTPCWLSRVRVSLLCFRVAWEPVGQATLYKQMEEWISGNICKLLNGTQSVRKLKLKRKLFFQPDNDPKHKTKCTTNYFRRHKQNPLEWYSQFRALSYRVCKYAEYIITRG